MAKTTIHSDYIPDNAITSSKIAENSIGAREIATNAITTLYVADGSVSSEKLASNIDIAGTFDVTGATTLDAGLTVDTDTLVVDATNDRVGIGDTSPATKLEITDANGVGLRFGDIASTPSSQTAGYIGMSTSAYSGNNGDLVLIPRTSSASNILLMEGNVGIGTDSPNYPLQVDKGATGDIAHFEGQGSVHLKIGEDSNTMYLDSNNGTAELAFRSNTVEKMRLDSSGNLGIGVIDPQAKLHIEVADNTEFLRATITGNESWAFKGASGSGATDYVSFGLSGSTQCMTWQEDGNVGIGTDNPDSQSRLTLNLPSGTNGRILTMGRSAGAYAYHLGIDASSRFTLYNNDGTSSLLSVDTVGRVHIGPYDSNHKGLTIYKSTNDSYTPTAFNNESLIRLNAPNAEGNYAGITYTHDGGTEFFTGLVRVGATSDITNYIFQGYNGNTNAYQEYMRIDASGNVLIGTTTSSNSSVKLEAHDATNPIIQVKDTTSNIICGIQAGNSEAVIRCPQDSPLVFNVGASETERMRIDSSGVKLPHDHLYSQEISRHDHNNFPTSYSASSAYTYSDNTDNYVYGPTGEKLVANVRARAFTNYIHLKTNLTANNIMFYVRTKGYFYAYGVEEILMGGYTYNNTQVLNKSFETIAGGTHNAGNNDLYRASSGNNLIIKIQLQHTGYTEGQMAVFFHQHGMDSSVMRDFRIVEVKVQNDGTNPY